MYKILNPSKTVLNMHIYDLSTGPALCWGQGRGLCLQYLSSRKSDEVMSYGLIYTFSNIYNHSSVN
jgi:hypothetical protein